MDRDDLFEKVYIATIAAIVGGQSARGIVGHNNPRHTEELAELMAGVAYTQAELAVYVFGDRQQGGPQPEFTDLTSYADFTDFVEDFDPDPDNQMEREVQDAQR